MIRKLLSVTAAVGLLLAGATNATPATAITQHYTRSVSVTGAVTTPASYTLAQLAAQPQLTLPDIRNHHHPSTVTGAELLPLVEASTPTTPAVKNSQLRVTVTVTGAGHRRVAMSLGELDPTGGNHPALLVPSWHRGHRGVDLVFPGDRGYTRTIRSVSTVRVSVAAPELPTNVPAGALRLVEGRRAVTLTAARLAELPTVTRTVSFLSGKGPQTHTETGPALAAVLRAGHIRTNAASTVAAIADDGYVATVTPAEATAGRRPLLLSTAEDGVSLAQPRLVTDGDVYGGRYVSGVLALEINQGCRGR